MSFPISQFYPLLLVLWAILFWCRTRVFRIALLASFALHAVFLVRVTGWGVRDVEPERIISFTFVQGAHESEEVSGREERGSLPLPSPGPDETASEDRSGEREEPRPIQENTVEPEAPRIQKELPKIDDPSLLDFSANPQAESYRKELQRLIDRHQQIPPEILKQGVEARVKVWFNLSRDGKLNQPIFVDPRIRSSRDTVNRAATESVMAASRYFPPFPEKVDRGEIWFYVFVDYANVTFSADRP